ncbi:hypothetical protein WH47_08808 [Habropoda laboriosa]|uniref:Uncharacterized protein n=1 Tax=Habropoda laboriosa TaxID=597456 RepID=A0A0L7R6B5_9HYME|nr:hypothetical protein WH47_08808 [Habropoda laboriosa]
MEDVNFVGFLRIVSHSRDPARRSNGGSSSSRRSRGATNGINRANRRQDKLGNASKKVTSLKHEPDDSDARYSRRTVLAMAPRPVSIPSIHRCCIDQVGVPTSDKDKSPSTFLANVAFRSSFEIGEDRRSSKHGLLKRLSEQQRSGIWGSLSVSANPKREYIACGRRRTKDPAPSEAGVVKEIGQEILPDSGDKR